MSFPLSHAKLAARSLAILSLLLLALSLPAEKIKDLKPQGYVNDFANVLSASAKEKLTALCTEVDHKAGAQIAVVTVSSLEGETADQYALDLATHWGVGPKQAARGVLILLAPTDHKYWTAVGYGLEPILPDGKVGGFGREAVPLLRQNDYDGALLLMTARVASVIAQDKGVELGTASNVPPPAPDRGKPSISPFTIIKILFFLFLFIGLPLIRFLSRAFSGGSRNSGSRGSGVPWWIFPFLGGGGGGSSWGGGGFGGGGGGGGGFGGFGGGSFGGGGAGGSW